MNSLGGPDMKAAVEMRAWSANILFYDCTVQAGWEATAEQWFLSQKQLTSVLYPLGPILFCCLH